MFNRVLADGGIGVGLKSAARAHSAVSILLVSIKIPRKTREVMGPSSFSGARGIPMCEAMWIIMLTLLAQFLEFGGPTVK